MHHEWFVPICTIIVVTLASYALSRAPDDWPTTWPMFATTHAGFFWDRDGNPLPQTRLGVHPEDSGGPELAELLEESAGGGLPPLLNGFVLYETSAIHLRTDEDGRLSGARMGLHGLQVPHALALALER